MRKEVLASAFLIILFILLAYFLLLREGARQFRFGLDLVGGTELIYRADTSGTDDVGGAMESLKEIIERRINIFGVSEPLVQTESAGLVTGNNEERLIVELPGVTDIEKAVALIGETPTLEFRLLQEENLVATGLTGRYLKRARIDFNPNTREPLISLEFDSQGRELFSSITKEHVGEVLGIVLDGEVISLPVIQEEISDGNAQITGSFTPEQARTLVRNLNYGALPVPIELASSETIGATLGEMALDAGMYAGAIGFLALSLFLILWYRLPGLVSVVALASYIILSLVIFKLIPITLTAAGIAGFILSIGMAVDANVLIFERAKEELRKGKSIRDSLHDGFSRAWFSIRDSNISSIITAVILFWLGTSAVKGFALTLGIGVIVSMFTAISVSRTLLFATCPEPVEGLRESKLKKFLFSNGFN